MDLSVFTPDAPGDLIPINGSDARSGPWQHFAFNPHPLSDASPVLQPKTYLEVANARAALAALDSTARRLPNPKLLRRPTLQTEAQSTSALEGTYAPLVEVLKVDEERPPNSDFREILNYVVMADYAFKWVESGRKLTVGLLETLQDLLVRGTKSENASAGKVRDHIVVIGRREGVPIEGSPVYNARFIPPPPGQDLRARLQDLLDWMNESHTDDVDPVVAAALGHYQFETLHPFNDGNGRIGRLLIVLHLYKHTVLTEPTLLVSPWFEARRGQYYDQLFGVSTEGAWDSYVRFVAAGLRASADTTHDRMLALIAVQEGLQERVRQSNLRADSAMALVEYAVGHPTFTVRSVQRDLNLSYGRANILVGQLVELGILEQLDRPTPERRFFAREVFDLLVRDS